MTSIQPLATIIGTITAGIFSLLLAEKFRIPSILFLLVFGVLLGPEFANLIQPEIFHENLPEYISLMVALILFEGGASLKISQLSAISNVVRNLLSIGVIVTLLVFSLLAHTFSGLPWEASILLASIMIVTGPTVVLPILRRIGVKENLHNILKWEAILIDPLGVIIAVVIFEFISSEKVGILESFGLFGGRLAIGILLGIICAFFILLAFRKKWFLRPHGEELGGLFVLAANILFYGISEWILPHSGLVTATTAGIIIGNQKFAYQEQIFHFKKQITYLALAVLFILLSSNVPIRATAAVLNEGFILLVLLIFIVRPLSVFLSTWNEKISFREKLFLAFLAPRGIVSAALASLFALVLQEQSLPGQEKFLPLAFLLIAGTIVFYAASSELIAKMLGVKEEKAKGIVMVGASYLGLAFAKIFREHQIPVKFIDTNPFSCRQAREQGFEAYTGNAFDQDFLESLDLKGIKSAIALTPNHEVNVLACQTFARYIGRNSVYRTWDKSDDWKTVTATTYDESWGEPLIFAHPDLEKDIWRKLNQFDLKIESKTILKTLKMSSLNPDLTEKIIPFFGFSKNNDVIFAIPNASFQEGSVLFYLPASS